MQLYKGRPNTDENRQAVEIDTYNFLDELGIEYFRVDHEQAETMEACEQIDKALGVKMCKNLFLCNRQKTEFYLLMMPGDKSFKTKTLSHALGISRLSFADESFMLEFLNIHPGSVSVMGLMNDKEKKVKLIIDREVINFDNVGCHPCVNTSSLKISTDDLLNKFLKAINHTPVILDMPQE